MTMFLCSALQPHDLRFRPDRKGTDVPRVPQRPSGRSATAADGAIVLCPLVCWPRFRGDVPDTGAAQSLRPGQQIGQFRVLGRRRDGRRTRVRIAVKEFVILI